MLTLRTILCGGLSCLLLLGCGQETDKTALHARATSQLADPINSPHAHGAAQTNTLYTAFSQRSPRSLDPARSYSSNETPFTYSIYEPLYGYHYLKRPYELTPRTAQTVAEPTLVDREGKVLAADAPVAQIAESIYDIKIRQGILYQPHPAFARDKDAHFVYYPLSPEVLKTKFAVTDFEQTGTRELTAYDYVYGLRRLASPRVASPIYPTLAEHIVGFREYSQRLREIDTELRKNLAPGDSDLPWLDLRSIGFAGIEALDAYTLRIRVKNVYPQFKYWLAMTFAAPIPWEADRFYSQPGMARNNLSFNHWPVGTGPYYMSESIQDRRHVLTRNPNFRGEPYPCEGEPGDAEAGLLTDCGKLTPFIDQVVFDMEKEAIPMMGKFDQGYYDVPQIDRGDVGVAMLVAASDSKDKASRYAERGIKLPTTVEAQIQYFGFNFKDPVIGRGDTPEQQIRHRKLRQAISIAYNVEEYVTIFQSDQAEVAHGPVPPGILGYQALPAGYNPVIYDLVDGKPVRKSLKFARQLLAEAGYPDGRDAVTGEPLVLHFDSTLAYSGSSQLEWMRRQFSNLGIQLDIRVSDYNRFQDKVSQGSVQMFALGWDADYPDAENFLMLFYGGHAKVPTGGENVANYVNPTYDALFDQMRNLPDGPAKQAVIVKMTEILREDAPWIFGFFPKSAGAFQQWVGNAKPTQMVKNTVQFLKIDTALRQRKIEQWNPPRWWPVGALVALVALMIWSAWRALRRQDRHDAFGELPR